MKGNNRTDFLFGLKPEYESYHFYQKQIESCDKQINTFLKHQLNTDPPKKTGDKKHKRINKNALKEIALNQASYQYFGGVDLMAIEGLSHATVLTIMSEVGPKVLRNLKLQKSLQVG